VADTVTIIGPLTAPHPIEACYGSATHCHWHDIDEPGDAYRVCFECKHAFRSAAELLAEHSKHLAEFGQEPETDPEQVYTCPLCIHDF
jgi:hypothetical protein